MILELPSEELSVKDSRKLDSLFDVLEFNFQESASCHGVCYTLDIGFIFGSYVPIMPVTNLPEKISVNFEYTVFNRDEE